MFVLSVFSIVLCVSNGQISQNNLLIVVQLSEGFSVTNLFFLGQNWIFPDSFVKGFFDHDAAKSFCSIKELPFFCSNHTLQSNLS